MGPGESIVVVYGKKEKICAGKESKKRNGKGKEGKRNGKGRRIEFCLLVGPGQSIVVVYGKKGR